MCDSAYLKMLDEDAPQVVQSMAGMDDPEKILDVEFYRTDQGNEPVREWLKGKVCVDDRKEIGFDIKTVQFGWPLGMPTVRKLDSKLWEVRTSLKSGIARVFFTVQTIPEIKQGKAVKATGIMVLLHGIVKKSQKTPLSDLRTAKKRLSLWEAAT